MSYLGNCKICYTQLGDDLAGIPGADAPSDADPSICVFCYKEMSADIDSPHREIIENAEERKRQIDFEVIVSKILTSTTNQIYGRQIIDHLGIARGGTVRSKNVVSDVGAELKAVVGGELKAYTQLLANAREQAIQRMKIDAAGMGADAIVGVNFSTSMISAGAAEITAFGTAVKLDEEPLNE
jgi:uncharacterized protein YbjQ (UPF0145 family)